MKYWMDNDDIEQQQRECFWISLHFNTYQKWDDSWNNFGYGVGGKSCLNGIIGDKFTYFTSILRTSDEPEWAWNKDKEETTTSQ